MVGREPTGEGLLARGGHAARASETPAAPQVWAIPRVTWRAKGPAVFRGQIPSDVPFPKRPAEVPLCVSYPFLGTNFPNRVPRRCRCLRVAKKFLAISEKAIDNGELPGKKAILQGQVCRSHSTSLAIQDGAMWRTRTTYSFVLDSSPRWEADMRFRSPPA